MARVVHFEIPVDDPERSRSFYRELFSWEVAGDADEGYWLATTGAEAEPGINGALINRGAVHRTPVLVVQVVSIDETLASVEAAGGRVVHGKRTIPRIGHSAYVEDSEGNVVGIFQPDGSASAG